MKPIGEKIFSVKLSRLIARHGQPLRGYLFFNLIARPFAGRPMLNIIKIKINLIKEHAS
ncbi:MAG: hypothetical protein H8E14_10430 [Candidatus Marinimicrobia bacterium]|nr:hypothetical protein [Candidatus Neomarinimicrobiota bacterium]